jgi:hypothetical protein
MRARCSVKANGRLRHPPHFALEVAFCDLKLVFSGVSNGLVRLRYGRITFPCDEGTLRIDRER